MLKFGFTERFSEACVKSLQKVWRGLAGKGMWPFLVAWDVVGLRATVSFRHVPKKYGPYGELFSSSLLRRSRQSTRRWWVLNAMKKASIMWRTSCSFAHHACSKILQGHFTLDVLYLLSGVSGAFLGLSDVWSFSLAF